MSVIYAFEWRRDRSKAAELKSLLSIRTVLQVARHPDTMPSYAGHPKAHSGVRSAGQIEIQRHADLAGYPETLRTGARYRRKEAGQFEAEGILHFQNHIRPGP
jgi:hypothetical protein